MTWSFIGLKWSFIGAVTLVSSSSTTTVCEEACPMPGATPCRVVSEPLGSLAQHIRDGVSGANHPPLGMRMTPLTPPVCFRITPYSKQPLHSALTRMRWALEPGLHKRGRPRTTQTTAFDRGQAHALSHWSS